MKLSNFEVKYLITFWILLFSTSINLEAQLPPQLWDFANTNTQMYFPDKLGVTEEFHIHTNHHFLRFNAKKLKLVQFRSNAPFERNRGMERLLSKTDFDILSMYLEYNGSRYKVIRDEANPSYLGEWVEGGKFFQRRFISGLKLEDGPLFKFGLEIASWADAFAFTLTYDENFMPEDEMKLIIEFDLPQEQYNISKKSKQELLVSSTNDLHWNVKSDQVDNSIKMGGGKIKIEAPLKNRMVSAIFSYVHPFQENGGIKVTATDRNSPFNDLKVKKDTILQATVVSLNDNMQSKFGMERTQLVLENTTNKVQFERLIFEKSETVKDITGCSIILRDKEGFPTGIPIQLSKNWHNNYYSKYMGPWIRGFTMVAIPPNKSVELEISRVSGYWGSLPAVSHSQLSLCAWGNKTATSHQLWEETAVGAFGESICYEPNGGLTKSMITDVRPLFVRSTDKNVAAPKMYDWTPNVGGGDFLRYYDMEGNLKQIKQMKVNYIRNCPNLSEVVYTGKTENDEADYKLTTHIIRSNDYLRAYYHVELTVNKTFEFSRLAIAQFGSETYAFSHENNFGYGNEYGILLDIENERDKTGYSIKNIDAPGAAPWASMHNAENPMPDKYGTWANRGLVLREWKSIIDGELVKPQFSTFVHYSSKIKKNVTLIELNFPHDIRALNQGDVIDAVIELCILPNEPDSYYGDNENFKEFMKEAANTWKPMFREAYQNTQKLNIKKGKLVRRTPLMIDAEDDEVVVDISNGVGYVPVTISNISNYKKFRAIITKNGDFINLKDQEKFGNDYWQTDYNPESKTWEVTYSIPMDDNIEP
ncbi:hypothetical protein [Flammeovirga sp. SubArs3]|uniref:hypothetical protein n=1 Tax=Flammeovirga sp. SubArs3 TaxID=2995316 RepID=UPI00248B2F35|nr:hypothetical protein [Flammeovirga sp. SubArs3]